MRFIAFMVNVVYRMVIDGFFVLDGEIDRGKSSKIEFFIR